MSTDLRYAFRMLARSPLVSSLAVLALALGIGANTAVFSVLDAVLVRPLPFVDPERLVLVWGSLPTVGQSFFELSYPAYRELRARVRSFEDLALMPSVNQELTLLGGREPVLVQGRLVSGNFFDVLGARAELGRALRADDERPGAARVVVLGHGLWQRRFGTDRSVIGRSVRVDGEPFTVVGVMPPAFGYPARAEVWLPIAPVVPAVLEKPNVNWAVAVGRLRPGVGLPAARAEVEAVMAGTRAAIGDPEVWRGVLTPLPEHVFGTHRTSLLVLTAAVALVLLMACANVAALLLARATARQRELAVRVSLGASRARLVRQLLVESGLVALLGGSLGVLIAYWGLDGLLALVPAEVPRLQDVRVDARVLAFAVALTALTALLAGLLPALFATRAPLRPALAESAPTVAGSARRPGRGLLVALQSAVALVLLATAALLTRSFLNLRRVDLGFAPQRLLALQLSLPRWKYEDPPRARRAVASLIDRLQAQPGVVSAAAVTLRPLWGRVGLDWFFTLEGQTEKDAFGNPLLNLQAVTPRYFQTMGIPLRRGRSFDDRDAEGAPGVVIVSESMARRSWPGRDPLGQRLKLPLPGTPYDQAWLTVIGVAGDARYRELQASRLDLYMSFRQSRERLGHVVVRTEGEPLALASMARNELRALDADLPLGEVASMDSIVATALGGPRFSMQLLSALSALALLLAAVGIYGVGAFVAGRRRQEMGIRVALGARAVDVLLLLVGQGMRPVLAGLLAGLLVVLGLGPILSGLLYGLRPADPLALGSTAALLALAGLLACLLPARRAVRVDPMRALRHE